MSRIDAIFTAAREEGRTLLMPFVTAGHPSIELTEAALPVIEKAGASIVEIGFPFSDPIADGPTIAASMHDALERGVSPRDVFEMVRRGRAKTQLGLVGMVSESIVDRIGQDAFVKTAAEAGLDGLIVPDADVASAGHLRDLAADHGLSFTLLVAPNTRPERRKVIVERCTGFVYLLARAGVTGEQAAAPEVGPGVSAIRELTDLPIAVGFGVSTADHVRAVTEAADAAIVGSALVRRMGEADDPVEAAGRFVKSLAGGLTQRS
jgi:tryptophan synthase alpha chain